MPVDATLIAELIAAGTPPELISRVALLVAKSELLEERKAYDRERQTRKRSRDVTLQDGQRVTSPSRASASRAEPEQLTPTTQEKQQQQKQASASEPKRSAGKTLIPENFEPKPSTFATALSSWGYSEAQVREKVDSLTEWSIGKGEKRSNWDMVLLGALRRDARPGTGPPNGNGHDPPLTGYTQVLHALQERRQTQEPKQLFIDEQPTKPH